MIALAACGGYLARVGSESRQLIEPRRRVAGVDAPSSGSRKNFSGMLRWIGSRFESRLKIGGIQIFIVQVLNFGDEKLPCEVGVGAQAPKRF